MGPQILYFEMFFDWNKIIRERNVTLGRKGALQSVRGVEGQSLLRSWLLRDGVWLQGEGRG